MTNNEGKRIQLQIDFPCTHSLIYNSQKYPINFDLFKYSSKYFFERRNEILENEDIDLTTYDPDDNISNFSPDEVIDFIKYIQTKPIQLTNNNIVTLQYFGHKYDINQLITITEEYINEHEEEIILKFLKRKELLKTVDLSFYEDKISANFSIYVNNDDILSLDINTLYRILEKVRMNNDKELKTSTMKNFLMKVLDKYGRPASILFQFADIDAFDDETLTLLLKKYSKNFEFEFITASVLNAFLNMKKEHLKYKEESKKKYESIVKELQEQKNKNDEMNTALEKGRQKHLKYEEESKKKYESIVKELQELKNKNDEVNTTLEKERQKHMKYEDESNNKYESILKELREQKKNNEEMNKYLLKCKAENGQLLENQRDERKEHEELIKELDKLKKQIISMKDPNNDHSEKHGEYNCEGTISICKYDENMIITNNADKVKVNNLLKYLIKEKDKHQKEMNSVEKVHDILFMKKKEVTTKNNDIISSHTEEDIFISKDMIDILYENGSLSSIELQNELKSIPFIYFGIQYPTPNFESIYSEIIKLKKNHINKIKISIFYEGKENTDQRFHNDKEINRLYLGNSVKNIESSGNDGLFQGCSSLTSVSIPSSVSSIGSYTFDGCSSLTSVSIPSSVTSIGGGVFERCSSLMSVSIPSSVTSIGDCAFYICPSLMSVSIPSSVTSIGYGTFYECSSLTSVSIPSSVTSIGSYAFYGCLSLKSISIPSSVTSIRNCAFRGCSSLKSISIPSSVTSIESSSFRGCSSLTSVSILSSVTSIGSYSFYGCSSLTSISIPSSVTSIESCAFAGCTKLNDIKIESFKEKKINYLENKFLVIKSDLSNDIYDILLWINPNNETIDVPGFIKTIGGGAFYECSSLTSVSIPSSVTTIGDYAFRGCSSLTSVSIPSSVTSIENGSFEGCSSLKNISIPSSVTSIGDGTFYGCSSLTSISISSSVTSIGYSAFYGCSSLMNISIPSSVTSIKSYAFVKCSSLTNISIPSSVTSIENDVFEGCSSLTSVSIPSSLNISSVRFNQKVKITKI